MARIHFPEGFRWGAATSAYQIEGAVDEDGRGESIWDRYASVEGRIQDGSSGKVACDHYHRWLGDLDLLARLELKAYRFSVAWPRVLPAGRGRPNSAGLDFYDRLVDGLLERGVDPVVTLYHWDLPQALQDRGGWPSRDICEAFVEYADVTARRLGDRVKTWVTHNEPWCAAFLGHAQGHHAPGITDPSAALAAAHHILLSHGMAITALRAASAGCEVGLCSILIPGYPASPSEADREATARHDDAINRWFNEPVWLGRYPRAQLERYVAEGTLDQEHPALKHPDDLRIMSTPSDFLAVNYYSRAIVRSDRVSESDNAPRQLFEPPDAERTDMGWEVYPDGMQDVLLRVHRDWEPPKIYVTECGVAYNDGPDADGVVRDRRRIDYLQSHFQAVHRAIEQGAPVKGIFVWSLLDNFEWSFGYTKRFGIVWVDYATQTRTPKASAHWYRNVVQKNGMELQQ